MFPQYPLTPKCSSNTKQIKIDWKFVFENSLLSVMVKNPKPISN